MAAPPFKIRTVCAFITLSPSDVTSPLSLSPLAKKLEKCAEAAGAVKAAMEGEGYEVQTVRIATNSYSEFLDVASPENFLSQLASLDSLLSSLSLEINFFSLGPSPTK